jgi:hypothetical protein
MIKRVYFRCKSLGKSPYSYDVIEASLAIQLNEEVIYLGNYLIQPEDSTNIQSDEWLKKCNIESNYKFQYTKETASKEICRVLDKHINKFVKEDRYILVVLNDIKDDNRFLEQLIYKTSYFKSYFFSSFIDVRVLFAELAKYKLHRSPDSTLIDIAKAFQIYTEYPRTTMDELKLVYGSYTIIQQFINNLYNHE